jgi:hypothetical protein
MKSNRKSTILIYCMLLFSLSYGVGHVDQLSGNVMFGEHLFEIRGRNMSFPVTLKYNSTIQRGRDYGSENDPMKPSRSSWVGLGFDLDMPYIERTIRGCPDNAEGHTRDYSLEDAETLKKHFGKIVAEENYEHYGTETYMNYGFDFYNYLIKLAEEIVMKKWEMGLIYA